MIPMATYRTLTSRTDLDAALEASRERPVVILKHSLACGASAAAFAEYRLFLERQKSPDGADYLLVEVQNARDVSDALARRTGVRHQSPQVLVLVDGQVFWSGSHWQITAETLARVMAGVAGESGEQASTRD